MVTKVPSSISQSFFPIGRILILKNLVKSFLKDVFYCTLCILSNMYILYVCNLVYIMEVESWVGLLFYYSTLAIPPMVRITVSSVREDSNTEKTIGKKRRNEKENKKGMRRGGMRKRIRKE